MAAVRIGFERLAQQLARAVVLTELPAHVDQVCGDFGILLEAIGALEGASPLTGIPPAVPGSIRLPPPALDEHGDAIRAYGWGAFA